MIWFTKVSLSCLFVLAVCASDLAQTHAQSFGNLNRYSNDNQILVASRRAIELVLIGDSITDKWPAIRPQFFKDTGWIGRGIVGETSAQMLLRFQQDVLDLSPSYVVIIAGTNDVAGNSGDMSEDDTLYYLRAMVVSARNNGVTPILCTIPPATLFPWAPAQNPRDRIRSLNERIRSLATDQDVPLIDFFAVLNDGGDGMRAMFSDDGVHPNNLGYAAMESRMKAQLPSIMSQ